MWSLSQQASPPPAIIYHSGPDSPTLCFLSDGTVLQADGLSAVWPYLRDDRNWCVGVVRSMLPLGKGGPAAVQHAIRVAQRLSSTVLPLIAATLQGPC
jgi:hypothetical protein